MAFDFFASDSAGNLYTSPVCEAFSTTTDTNGHWSVDISGLGYTHVYAIAATVKSADNTPANAAYASVSTFSTTTVAGGAAKPVNVGALGGPPTQGVGSGVTIYVIVVGDQA